MKKVRIIGVPEHFNYPWHLAISENAFKNRGIDLEWQDIPEGTGRMCKLLDEQEADLAIILTEGIVKSISDGNQSKIVQEFIATPLRWGIHVGYHSTYQKISDLKGTKAAISRYGSGSHLMAYVHAQEENWNTETLNFEIINNLAGSIEALTSGKADYFLWEHFTTKPLVDNGTFRRIGNTTTPWPCFVIAGNSKFIDENKGELQHILEVINQYTREFKDIPSIDRTLANYYNQQLSDIQEWLTLTRWSQKQIDSKVVDKVNTTLGNLNLIKKTQSFSRLCFISD